MKTMTNRFLYMAILVVLCFFDILCLGTNIYAHDWWGVAVSAVAIAICVWAICLNYKRAKRIEESMEARIRMIYDILPIDETIVHRIMSEVFKGIKTKAKEDEMAEDNGTPV